MSSSMRALLGAVVGSLLTLLFHPASRPYLLSCFWHEPAIESNAPLDGSVSAMLNRAPSTLQEASTWIQAGCERIVGGSKLSSTELKNLILVARSAARQDPDNAYWKQTGALFCDRANQPSDASDFWRRASACTTWNDEQSPRLMKMRDDLSRRYGATESWQLAVAYYQRSLATVNAVAAYAGKRLERAAKKPEGLLNEQVLAIRNGSLIRDNSRSMEGGMIAAQLVDGAYRPADLAVKSERVQVELRNQFLKRVREKFGIDTMSVIHHDFVINETFKIFVYEPRWASIAETNSLESVLIGNLPSALLACGLGGLLLWLAGILIQQVEPVQILFRYPAVFSLGLVAGFGAYALTMLPFAGLAIGLSAWFLVFSPRQERKVAGSSLGTMFTAATSILAFSLATLLALELVLNTASSRYVFASLEGFSDKSIIIPSLSGLVILVLGLTFLIAPFWAFSSKNGTTAVLHSVLKKMGFSIAVVCLPASIILTLGAFYVDQKLGVQMQELVENEILHYYHQR